MTSVLSTDYTHQMRRIRVIRERQDIGLRELSRRSRVGLATLVRLEAGNYDPRLSTLRSLARALNVTIAELIGESKGRTQMRTISQMRSSVKTGTEWDVAADKAIKALEEWRRQYLVKGLEPLIWPYEYEQIQQAEKLLHVLLRNVKGPDPRERE